MAYVVLMLIGAGAARQVVVDAWQSANGTPPVSLMVGPRPVTPLTRDVIIDAGDHYVTGTFRWLPASVTFAPQTVSKNDLRGEVTLARQDPGIQAFLVWSRFPAWTLTPGHDETKVTVSDMRFGVVRRLFGRSGFEATTTIGTGSSEPGAGSQGRRSN